MTHADLVRNVAERNNGGIWACLPRSPIEQAIFGPLVQSGAVA